MKKTLWAIAAIIIIVLIISFATKKAPVVTNTEPIKIGGAFILSGPQALIGEVQKNAAVIAVEEINATGGINGRPVELVLEDSSYEPKTALSAYEALKLKGVNYIIGDGSPVVSAIRPAAVKDGKLFFAVGATTPGYFDGSNLSCRIALTAKNFGPGFVQLMQKKGYKTAAALLPDNEYGRGLSDELTKAAAAASVKIVATEFYNASPTGGDYRTNITKLKAIQGQVDTMIAVQVSNTVEAMLKQIKELGWTKPIISDYYMVQNPALKTLSLANGIDYLDYQYSRDSVPTESAAAKSFKEKYVAKHGAAPVFLGAGHYEVVKIIAQAIKNAGEEPQKVADYISHLQNYDGVTGMLTFNDDCEISRTIVFRTVVDGKIVDLK